MSYQNYGYNQNGYGQPGYGQAEPTANNNGTALGWDDEVEEKSFILLPEGEYPFRVEGFDREQHNGTEKMPPCNVANLHIVINFNGEDVRIDKKLFLLSTNGQLFAFFRSIGSPVLPDGRIKMDWSKVYGATGRLLINHRRYNGNEYNNIKQFIDPTRNNPAASIPPADTASERYAQPQINGYTPGKW